MLINHDPLDTIYYSTPNPIKLFSASIEATLKFEPIRAATWPVWWTQIGQKLLSVITLRQIFYMGSDPGPDPINENWA